KEKAYEAVNNYQNYIDNYSKTESLEKYWSRTGKTLKFIRRNPSGVGKSQGVEHWVPPSEGKLRSSNWTDILVLNAISNDLGLSFPSPKNENLLSQIFIMGGDECATILDYFAGSGTTGHAVINLNREDGGKRKYILVEMGDHFDTVLKPRLEKVVFSQDWKDGKPVPKAPVKLKQKIHHNETVECDGNGNELTLSFDVGLDSQTLEKNEDFKIENPFNGVSHCFKYMRLESYEDTLNNLVMPEHDTAATAMPPSLKEDYMLHYLLDTETRDSLLNMRDFSIPFGGYRLNVKEPDSDASVSTAVDLIETFHYLIGLRVEQYYRIQSYSASFKRAVDPELPDNGAGQRTRLEFDGRPELDDKEKWRFQKIEGKIPANPLSPNDGQTKNVLILWRTLTGDLEQDNLMLDWYLGDTINLNEKRAEYDIIYVNGSNTLGADRKETDSYQVRLIEEEFLKKMWSGEEY
ncbi:MAG: DNA methyltransferase, partial [Evtepia sp.]